MIDDPVSIEFVHSPNGACIIECFAFTDAHRAVRFTLQLPFSHLLSHLYRISKDPGAMFTACGDMEDALDVEWGEDAY